MHLYIYIYIYLSIGIPNPKKSAAEFAMSADFLKDSSVPQNGTKKPWQPKVDTAPYAQQNQENADSTLTMTMLVAHV